MILKEMNRGKHNIKYETNGIIHMLSVSIMIRLANESTLNL